MEKSRIIQGLMRSESLTDEALYDLILFDLQVFHLRKNS